LLDFGVTEVFVREICRDPASAPRLMRVLTAAKLLQAPAAYVLLVIGLLLLHYPAHVVRAALIGGLAMFCYAGVLIYRVVFRSRLLMEREVAAELVSVVAMIPMIALASRWNTKLPGLLACHVLSRGIFFALSFAFGRAAYDVAPRGVTRADLRWAWNASAAIGAIGLLVGVYEAIDILLLSKLSTLSEVAHFSAAQRLAWPALMALASVGATLYPVAASFWPAERDRFESACQRGVDTVALLAGLGLCPLLAGAGFFLSLLGREMTAAAPVLRVMAVLCVIKAITSTLGPLLYVVHAQKSALRFIAVALVAKAAVLLAVAPRFGAIGVAWAAVALEIGCALIPSAVLIRRYTGYRVRWSIPARVTLAMFASAALASLAAPHTPLAAAVLAPVIFVPLVLLSGAVRTSDLKLLSPRGAA
jgi:O-antigen/teichoic acid export membrane protein